MNTLSLKCLLDNLLEIASSMLEGLVWAPGERFGREIESQSHQHVDGFRDRRPNEITKRIHSFYEEGTILIRCSWRLKEN